MEPTNRMRVRRHSERGVYDRPSIEAILDESMIAHVAFVADGQPWALPMAFGRIGDQLYVHGAVANRMLKSIHGAPMCLTVTLLDGLVLARSAFHHSMNFRSVVVVGNARLVEEVEEKTAALRAVTDHNLAGRWDQLRAATFGEINATIVMALPLDEASAKVRTGPPVDDAEDMQCSVWAGVIPIETRRGSPVTC